jgi:hypothetical protein
VWSCCIPPPSMPKTSFPCFHSIDDRKNCHEKFVLAERIRFYTTIHHVWSFEFYIVIKSIWTLIHINIKRGNVVSSLNCHRVLVIAPKHTYLLIPVGKRTNRHFEIAGLPKNDVTRWRHIAGKWLPPWNYIWLKLILSNASSNVL